jgi:predicted nucleotidyltransferase
VLLFGLSQKNVDRLSGVFAKYPLIDHIDIFGSRAKGTFRSGSDIDLAVYTKGGDDPQFSNLWLDVDALPIAFKIDLVDMNRLQNEKLAASIKRDGVRFYPLSRTQH